MANIGAILGKLVRGERIATVRGTGQRSKDRAARRSGLISARQQKKQRKAERRARGARKG